MDTILLDMSLYNVLFTVAILDAEFDYEQAKERTNKYLSSCELTLIENNSLFRLLDQNLE